MALAGVMRRAGGADIAVTVRNLSTRGMMAECALAFSRGEPVEIELPGIGTVAGNVAWMTGGRVGATFAAPIDPSLARKPFSSNRTPPD